MEERFQLYDIFLKPHCFGLLSVTIKIRVLLKWSCVYKINIMCIFTMAVSIRCISTGFGTGYSLPNGNFSVCLDQCFWIPVLCDWLIISIIFFQFIFSPAKSNPNSCMFSSCNGGRVCTDRIGTTYKTR